MNNDFIKSDAFRADAHSRKIAEWSVLKKLFSEKFNGVVLIDRETQRVSAISDDLAGKLLPLVSKGDSTYDVLMNAFIDKYVSRADAPALRFSTSFAVVLEKLESQTVYETDFNVISANNGYEFHRVSYEYLGSDKKTIVFLSENVSKLVAGEIDPLTGGYNSTGFYNRVNEWIAANPGKKFRIQRYNLDRFRDINGVYGLRLGDKLLRDIADYMKGYDNKDSFSAHLNADHFVRFCTEDALPVQQYYDNFVNSFSTYRLNIPITLHIGVYDLCESDNDSYTMSYKALLALQEIKGNMNVKIAYYESGMMRREKERLELLNDVEDAIKNHNFEIRFQPQVDYSDGRIFGAEALIRWNHPRKGSLSPATFIPLLEKSNYIEKVDLYVVGKVCEFVKKWLSCSHDKKIQVSVNLSRQDFINPDFIDKLERIVDSYGVPFSAIRLEITESAYVKSSKDIIRDIAKLRNDGFAVEIDDFGSGYSTLNTLKNIDADALKLDMAFLSKDGCSKKQKIILSSIINMSRELGLLVIAEGVETKEQAEMLYGFGCKLMQGYYFSKPVPAEDYEKLLFSGKGLPDKNPSRG